MASYDPYDRDHSRRYMREERRDERDPRYVETRETYVKSYPNRELVPRAREDSDLSVEEIRRDFPPPTGSRDVRRTRSAEPGYYEDEVEYRRSYDPRDRDHDRRNRRSPGSIYYDDEDRKKPRGMTKEQKIIAAVAGAALLAGGKELYDRREAKEERTEIQRNPLASAALAGVGALAAYQGAEFYSKQQAKKDQKANYILQHRGRGHYDEYYSDDENTAKEKKGHKNFLESAIAATGLGAAVKSLTGGGGDDHRSETRSRRGDSPSSTRSRSRSGANKIQKAAMASLLAGATEAFRVSKEPGGWKGEKSKRILTAAIGAAAVDTATDDKGGKLGLAESVIGGLVGNRLLRGSKNDIEEDRATGRSRSRSRARSGSRSGPGGGTGLAALATAGLGALGAKKALDRSRSRSRNGRGDSYSRSPDRRRERSRSRSRSVVDRARNSLAKLGLGAGAGAGAAAADEYRRRDQDDYSDRGSRHHHYPDDDYDDDYRRSARDRDYYDDERAYRDRPRDRGKRGGKSDYSSSDLGSSSEDEKRAKKMRGKQVLTTGLATIATIHAAHGVYQSMEKRNARHKAVKEGVLSPDQAKMLKRKAMLQDAASVGIAAMGIKGALSECKEAKDLTQQCKQFQEEKARRHQRRLEKRRQRLGMGERKRSDSWGPTSRPYESPRTYDGGYESDVEFDRPRYYDDRSYGATSIPPAPNGNGRPRY